MKEVNWKRHLAETFFKYVYLSPAFSIGRIVDCLIFCRKLIFSVVVKSRKLNQKFIRQNIKMGIIAKWLQSKLRGLN